MMEGGQQLYDGGGLLPPSLPPLNDMQEEPPEELSHRQKVARGTLAKIDKVYASVHALQVMSNLLEDACSYLEIFSNDTSNNESVKKALLLPCECIRLTIDGLNQHHAILGKAVAHSTETKEVVLAQKKLMKSQTAQYAQKQMNNNNTYSVGSTITAQLYDKKVNPKVMERDPQSVLNMSLQYARDTLGDMLKRTHPDFIVATKGEGKKKKRKKDDNNNDPSDDGEGLATKKQKIDSEFPPDTSSGEGNEKCTVDVIDLPSLMDGKTCYSPLEAVSYIQNMVKNNPGKMYVKAYKRKMMGSNLVPVKSSQLNSLVKQYGGRSDTPMAPLHWNNRGAKSGEWDNLVVQFQARQNQKQSWSMDDTKNTLQSSETMEKDRKEIHPRDVEACHNNLIALHNTQNHINQQIQIQEQRLKENPPMIPVKVQQQNRKHPPTSSSSSVKANRFDKNNSKYDGIDLPSPADGNLMYTPSECVTTIMNFMQSSNNSKPNRSDVRLFKEKIIANRLIPISISQLNYLLAKHGGPGSKNPAPRCWNLKGRQELLSIDDLVNRVNESHCMWTIDNTRDVIWTEKKAKEGDDAKRPDPKTVHAYHTALLSIPELGCKVLKPEPVKQRQVKKSSLTRDH